MQALSGIRVLELSQMWAVPGAAMYLADHGAQVIKVEPLGGRRSAPDVHAAARRWRREPGLPCLESDQAWHRAITVAGRAPLLGEHTEEILLELGYPLTMSRDLEEQQTIRCQRAVNATNPVESEDEP